MPRTAVASPGETLRAALSPLTGTSGDYDGLIDLIGGDARRVLLGEASHGTHEFYRERARITQRLIEERGFTVVAIEADWPDAYRVNRWIRGTGDDTLPRRPSTTSSAPPAGCGGIATCSRSSPGSGTTTTACRPALTA